MTTLGIVGSQDQQLLTLLKNAGMSARVLDASALASLGRATSIPDALIIDTRDGSGVPSVLPALKRAHPQLGMVIIATALDPALMLEAMRAGVSELIAEPLTQDEFEQAITRVLAQQRPQGEAGKTFGFIGAKGGVGTTTVAVNVAAALSRAERGRRTLLIDMHLAGGDAALFAGAEPTFSVLDVLENTHRLDLTYFNGLVSQVGPNLDLLASSDQLFAAAIDPAKMRAILDFVARENGFVVLDLPRWDRAMLDTLDTLAALFIVADQGLATVRSAARLAGTLRERYGPDIVRIVLNRLDRHAEIGIDDVERATGARIAHKIPNDYRASKQALNKGRPLVFDGESDMAAAFKKFADKLTGHRHEEKAASARLGLLGRLTQRA